MSGIRRALSQIFWLCPIFHKYLFSAVKGLVKCIMKCDLSFRYFKDFLQKKIHKSEKKILCDGEYANMATLSG